ncbi:hypothetical protein [Thiosocius teredinicola]|uniref:hypothetical protein n=1 Tax=Thiosocius teredinicola TaxID=1973002 RepID=UPI0009910A82
MFVNPRMPLALVLLLTLPTWLWASQLDDLKVESIDAMSQRADKIGVINIMQATVLLPPSECGVLYRGTVVEAIKNVEVGESVTFFNLFDHQSGLRAADQFVVFLDKRDSDSSCAEAEHKVANAGYGALRVDVPTGRHIKLPHMHGVRIPQSFVVVPEHFSTWKGQSSDIEISKTLWVKYGDLLSYLKKQHRPTSQ